MIKKVIYGQSLREQLEASQKDKLYQFLLGEGTVRGVLLHATKLVNEMQANHETGIWETLILGYAYLGALLLASSLKGQERLLFKLSCTGPLVGLEVEANSFGEVRGYLKARQLPALGNLTCQNKIDLKPFWEEGSLRVIRYLEKAKAPFEGQVELTSGSFALNLAYYLLQSEQTPSACSLSIHLGKNGEVLGAGGLLIQALPGATAATLKDLEKTVEELPSIGQEFAAGTSAQAFILSYLAKYCPEVLSERRVAFMCHCSQERFKSYLKALGKEELAKLVAEGPFPLRLTCYNCNTTYEYSQADLGKLLNETP